MFEIGSKYEFTDQKNKPFAHLLPVTLHIPEKKISFIDIIIHNLRAAFKHLENAKKYYFPQIS